MCGGEKRENTEVSAKSVGLPVVPFQYGLSLFVCLSKWFTFFVCPSVTVRLHGRLLRLVLTVRGLAKCGTFSTKLQSKHQSSNLAQSFIRSTSPRISPNPCYRLPFCRGVSCRVGCAIGVFLFFQKEGKKKMKF